MIHWQLRNLRAIWNETEFTLNPQLKDYYELENKINQKMNKLHDENNSLKVKQLDIFKHD